MITDSLLLREFRKRLRYKRASSWQKPFLNPAQFTANQLRKHGLTGPSPGEIGTVDAFHLRGFSVVRGEGVSEEIASYGIFEPELTEAFLRLVQPGQVIVDIGMHLGYYTTLFATLVGGQGQVHAFEPTPSTREIAERNVARFPQVTVHPFAVWSSAQTIAFRDFGPRWMAFNSLSNTSKLEQDPVVPKEIQVETIPLDAFRRSLNCPVALLKIDAESAEKEIIKGGCELLEQDRPVISVEVGDTATPGESAGLIQLLTTLGFVPWEFHSGRFTRHQPRSEYRYDNLIFAPESLDLNSA